MAEGDIAGQCPNVQCGALILEWELRNGWCLDCGEPVQREELLQPKDFI